MSATTLSAPSGSARLQEIERRDFVEQRADEAREIHAGAEASRGTGADGGRGPRQHGPDHARLTGAEGGADSDLLRALNHGVAEHTVEPDAHEDESERAEERRQEREQPLAEQRVVHERRLQVHARHPERRIQASNRPLEHRRDGLWSGGGSNLERAQAPQRHVDRRGRRIAQAPVSRVGDDAEDVMDDRAVPILVREGTAHRTVARKVATRERLVDHDARRAWDARIVARERPAVAQSDLHRVEEPVGHGEEVRFHRVDGAPRQPDRARPPISAEQRPGRRARGRDAGQLPQVVEDLLAADGPSHPRRAVRATRPTRRADGPS